MFSHYKLVFIYEECVMYTCVVLWVKTTVFKQVSSTFPHLPLFGQTDVSYIGLDVMLKPENATILTLPWEISLRIADIRWLFSLILGKKNIFLLYTPICCNKILLVMHW